jgi:hypothetical protein
LFLDAAGSAGHNTDNKNDGIESEDNSFLTEAGKLATQYWLFFSKEIMKAGERIGASLLKHEINSLGFVQCLRSVAFLPAELAK